MRNGLIVEDGTQRWYLDDKLHRENDLPAVIYKDGSQLWYLDDTLHRENGPAIIFKGGSQLWWRRQYHRENGIFADGYQQWYRHGKEINVKKWIKDNDITSAWETWDDLTWSLFRLEFL